MPNKNAIIPHVKHSIRNSYDEEANDETEDKGHDC